MVGNISNQPQLNMPSCNLHLRESEAGIEVLDIVRKRYVALTPEEWVRQHVVHMLINHMGYPLDLIQVEGAITLNGMSRRCDVVVYNTQVHQIMIIECKKPDVIINQKVIDQACRYNTVLNVPYLYITNGIQHLMLEVNFAQKCLKQLSQIPLWDSIKI